MRDFAVAYPYFPFLQEPLAKFTDDSILQAPLAKLPWYHPITLMSKVKDRAIRLFYIQQTIQNGWSRNVLVLQIENELHKRQGKALNNFSQTLPAHDSDLAVQTFKSPYILEFLTLNDATKERDIERGLIEHLKKFMLELGKGFAYVGNQFNLAVEDDDYFLDCYFTIITCIVLLFLNSYVVYNIIDHMLRSQLCVVDSFCVQFSNSILLLRNIILMHFTVSSS